MRYIEVLTNARVERRIEAYETMLELTVSCGKRSSCVDESLALREEVLAAIKEAGLSDDDIREGGGGVEQNRWSSSKSIVHRIVVQNPSMDVLISAMAAVERLFAAKPQPFFARVKKNFSFPSPSPVYAPAVSAEDAMRDAVRKSRSTAEVLARESGVRLGGMLFIREFTANRAPDGRQGQYFEPSDSTLDLCSVMECIDPDDSIPYHELPAATSRAARTFVVRFAAEDAEPTEESGKE